MRAQKSPLPAKISQPEAARLYNSLAKIYDAWGKLTEARARNRVIELAEIKDGQSILEVAAGTGLAFVELVRSNPRGRNVAIDISAGMLEKAKYRLGRAGLSNFEIKIGSAFEIDEPNASIDTVLNNYMFDLLDEPDWPKALREFHRVLKPGGRLVLANMTQGQRTGSGVYERLYRLCPSMMGGCRSVSLSGPLRDCGFEVRLREYHQQFLFPSEVILARKVL